MNFTREQKYQILGNISERCPQCGDRSWYLVDYMESRKPTLGPPCPDNQEKCTCAFVQCGECGAEYNRYVPPMAA